MSQVLRKSPSFHRGPRLTGNGEGGLAIPEHRIWMERAQNRHSELGVMEEVGAAVRDQTLRPKAGMALQWWGRASSLRSRSS